MVTDDPTRRDVRPQRARGLVVLCALAACRTGSPSPGPSVSTSPTTGSMASTPASTVSVGPASPAGGPEPRGVIPPSSEPASSPEGHAEKTCLAFELQTRRAELQIPVVVEMLRDTYFERILTPERAHVLDREGRRAALRATGIRVTGEIDERTARRMLEGSEYDCFITAGFVTGPEATRAIFTATLHDGDAPVVRAKTESSLVDAEMKDALGRLVEQLDE